jgi:RimJ/RimL family protein N-acetyltransferase
VSAAVRAAPVLVTERLELWVPTRDDVAAMLAIVADPATGRYLGQTQSAADHFARFSRNAGSWLLYGYGSFMVRERAGGELIGNCGVFHTMRGLGEDFDDNPEAGWILRSDRVGRGLAAEAMTAALAWFEREHGRRRIVCLITPDNRPSLGLAAKLGFVPLRDAAMPEGDAVRLFERPAVVG